MLLISNNLHIMPAIDLLYFNVTKVPYVPKRLKCDLTFYHLVKTRQYKMQKCSKIDK